MKINRALMVVKARWQLSSYRLSKVSGVGLMTIINLLNGKQKAINYSKVQQIADGLAKIDPIAKPAFYGALELSDEAYPGIDENAGIIHPEENPEAVRKTILALIEMEVLSPDKVRKLRQNCWKTHITFEQRVSLQMQELRRKKEEEPN